MLDNITANSLLCQDYIDYLLEWQKMIGIQDSVLANAAGPDIVTIAVSTNSPMVYVSDPYPFSKKNFEFFLENYSGIESDLVKIPAFNTKLSEMPLDFQQKLLEESLGFRKKFGYYDNKMLDYWSAERLSMIELKMMGIRQEDIYFDYAKSDLRLNYKWHYGPMTDRQIIYLKNGASDLADLPKTSCFHQKGFYTRTDETISILKRLRCDTMLLGTITSEKEKPSYHANICRLLSDYSQIKSPPFSRLELQHQDLLAYQYGMQLSGFQKTRN
ncbi:MAG: hypothetical protein NDI94_06835 [Candidatus Woesearchaeota archaeon]|nr:hypothetical protein [Candidatus Woesearchaeota archaeon]